MTSRDIYVILGHTLFPICKDHTRRILMKTISDFDLLIQVSEIYSQQAIADRIRHPREVINRWIKDSANRKAYNWLTYAERMILESMLPARNDEKINEFTFIDLFAGIGGLRKGFEEAGGKCVFTSEYDTHAIKTYKANFFCDHEVHGDIKEITQPHYDDKKKILKSINSKIPDHDVLVAGFPCQPFSIAGVSKKNSLGRKHGFEDNTQGTLFFDVARIIEAKKPIAVMLENVKNLKSHDKGRTFRVIVDTLEELGYEIADRDYDKNELDPRIINGRNFVPQNRERIVLVAFNKNYGGIRDLTLKDIKNFYPKTKLKVGDILEPEQSVDKKYILTPKLWSYLREYAKKHKKAGNGFGFGKVNAESEYTRTLSARYYKDGSEALIERGKRKRPRRLTPRECARLMGFDNPDEVNFIIPVSDTQAYKQFGNSVVVPVFSSVAKIMKPYILQSKIIKKTSKKTTSKNSNVTLRK